MRSRCANAPRSPRVSMLLSACSSSLRQSASRAASSAFTVVYSLVRRYIKTAIGFLAVGLILGGWMIARRELWGRFATPFETSAHTHAIFVGFVMLMICGVAL